MIEPTDEMRMAAYRSAREWAFAHRHQQPDDRMINEVLAAVLAIVERDYRLYPLCAETLAGMRCERSAGICHPRQDGRIEHMAHAPGGAVVTWQ